MAAAHAPATLWATQSALIPRGYRLAIVFAVYLAVLLLVANFLHRLGVENAFFSVAMVGLLFSYAARAFDSGSILVLVCVALVVVLHGLRQSRWLHYLMVVLVFVGATGPPAQWLMQFVSRTPSELQTLGQIDSPASAEQPDVWILVLDGYPSSWALENLFGADSAPLADRLQQAGFIVNPNALAPYPWTVAAVASVLESSPVAPPGVRIGHSEMVEVRRLLGGGAATFRALEESGYRTIVLESTWHLSRCNAGVDSCITSPWYDEAMQGLSSQSGLQLLNISTGGSAFARGALQTFEDLGRLASISTTEPRLVFAHSLAPHPPIELARDCSLLPSEAAFGGGWLGKPEFDSDEVAARRSAFLEQVSCIDHLVGEFVDSVPADDVVVVFGDHGTDLLGQTSIDTTQWSRDMFRERHLTFAAVRTPGCEVEPVATLTLFRQVLGCLGGGLGDAGGDLTFRLDTVAADGETPPVEPVPPAVASDLLSIAQGSIRLPG